MRYKRIVDLSQPIINGGGFGRPAQITYSDHRSRGKALADQLGIDPKNFDYKTNNKSGRTPSLWFYGIRVPRQDREGRRQLGSGCRHC